MLMRTEGRTWYAVCPCEIMRFSGIDLALHNSMKRTFSVLILESNRWSLNDPLTGALMFNSVEGDTREEFLHQVQYAVIPLMMQKFEASFPELVAKTRRRHQPAPHPSSVEIILTP